MKDFVINDTCDCQVLKAWENAWLVFYFFSLFRSIENQPQCLTELDCSSKVTLTLGLFPGQKCILQNIDFPLSNGKLSNGRNEKSNISVLIVYALLIDFLF